MAKDKFKEEFERLLRQHGRIIALLYLVDANVHIRQELEHENNLPHTMKRSVEVERSREKLQKDLATVKQSIEDIMILMTKYAKGGHPTGVGTPGSTDLPT
jgi:hypothetical protein